MRSLSKEWKLKGWKYRCTGDMVLTSRLDGLVYMFLINIKCGDTK